MAKKTNKTSHVLDLLTHGTSSDMGDTASDGAKSGAGVKKVTVVDESSRNDRVSQEILNNLSEELERERAEAPEEKEPVQTPEPAAAPAQEPASPNPVQAQDDPEPAPVQETPAQSTPQAEETAPEEEQIQLEDIDDTQEQSGDDEFHFVNVMEQLLLKQDISGFMKQYNVCTCKRCNADVRALTLTALPAKYVVIGKRSFSPVLNYYENKFKIEMLTALSKACSTVRDTPHHKR